MHTADHGLVGWYWPQGPKAREPVTMTSQIIESSVVLPKREAVPRVLQYASPGQARPSPVSPFLPLMSPPPPPPPPPPLRLPFIRGSRTSLRGSLRPSHQGSPVASSASHFPTAKTTTDVLSKADLTSRAELEGTESSENIPRLAPELDRSRSKRTKVTRGNTSRSKLRFGYGWGLGWGHKDKGDLFTEVDRSSFATTTTILPVDPREVPPFMPDNGQTPTRHMPQRSKTSRRPSLGSGSVNTLVGSALERKEANQDHTRERVDTSLRLAELRQLMAKDNLDY